MKSIFRLQRRWAPSGLSTQQVPPGVLPSEVQASEPASAHRHPPGTRRVDRGPWNATVPQVFTCVLRFTRWFLGDPCGWVGTVALSLRMSLWYWELRQVLVLA